MTATSDDDTNDEFGPWCPDVGLEHDWSEWQINEFFDLREDRFCSRCGGMESQTICTDPNCKGDRDHRAQES